MKITLLLFLALLFFEPVKGQTGGDIFLYETTFYLDQNGSSITQTAFQNALKENPGEYHFWDRIENDSIRVSRLIPKKERLKVSYPEVFKSMEKITNNAIAGNPLIIIFYNYTDDFCSPASSFNYWDALRIRKDKRISDNLKRRVQQQYPNVIAFHLFEPGINIEPSQLHKEYFFIDRDQYFRKRLFKAPASCGSIAIIKPGGETMIHHGETSVPLITASLAE